MPSPVEICPVRESDVAALTEALGPDVGPEQVEQRWLESLQGHREMLVAVLDSRPVGTVSVGGFGHILKDSLRMFALDVGPAFRRMGIGTELIRSVEGKAGETGLTKVNLEVETRNVEALQLYEQLGYRRLGQSFTETWMDTDEDGEYVEVKGEFLAMMKVLG